MLCMQVYRNLSLVDEYWLKYGNYHVTVETKSKDADFLLKYPKCPVSIAFGNHTTVLLNIP